MDASATDLGKQSVALADNNKPPTTAASKTGTRLLQFLLAAALMLVAANSFLRYLWWSACYSAWSGIPKLHNQWLAAGSRATFNGWSVIILALASATVLFTLLRPKSSDRLGVIASVSHLILAAILTIAGTAFFALVLSWVKQGIR